MVDFSTWMLMFYTEAFSNVFQTLNQTSLIRIGKEMFRELKKLKKSHILKFSTT
jgi:hypothetical protein